MAVAAVKPDFLGDGEFDFHEKALAVDVLAVHFDWVVVIFLAVGALIDVLAGRVETVEVETVLAGCDHVEVVFLLAACHRALLVHQLLLDDFH